MPPARHCARGGGTDLSATSGASTPVSSGAEASRPKSARRRAAEALLASRHEAAAAQLARPWGSSMLFRSSPLSARSGSPAVTPSGLGGQLRGLPHVSSTASDLDSCRLGGGVFGAAFGGAALAGGAKCGAGRRGAHAATQLTSEDAASDSAEEDELLHLTAAGGPAAAEQQLHAGAAADEAHEVGLWEAVHVPACAPDAPCCHLPRADNAANAAPSASQASTANPAAAAQDSGSDGMTGGGGLAVEAAVARAAAAAAEPPPQPARRRANAPPWCSFPVAVPHIEWAALLGDMTRAQQRQDGSDSSEAACTSSIELGPIQARDCTAVQQQCGCAACTPYCDCWRCQLVAVLKLPCMALRSPGHLGASMFTTLVCDASGCDESVALIHSKQARRCTWSRGRSRRDR